MKAKLALSAALAALLAWASPAAAQTFTLKYGHVAPASETADDHLAGLFLKSFLEARSNGRVKVEIYPASQLGDFRALIEGVQLGTVELAHTSVGGVGQFFPEIQVLELPYIIPDDKIAEHISRGPLVAEIRDLILKKTGNVRMLAAGNTGRFRSFFTTRKPVLHANDLKGLKLRVLDSPMMIEFARFYGANPTVVAWGEVYTSLKTNVIEGLGIAATDIVPNNMHDSVRFVTLDEHAYLWGFYWIGDKWLKSLPRDLQDLVVDGVTQMNDVQVLWNKQYEGKSLEIFAKSGGKIATPTPEQRASFVAVRDPLKKWFAEKYGKEWVEKLEKAVADAQVAVAKERDVLIGRN
jgi:TRAP-type C4-dicarboxylate transport system substrate-binding protein